MSRVRRLQASQPGLFGAAPQVLAHDAEGGIVYTPGFVDAARAATWFATLRDEVAWSSERRLMYEREVEVPRLVARYRLDEPLPPGLNAIAVAVARATGGGFNTVGLNYYRDGADSVAPHHDTFAELVPGHPVVLLSLGATRRMAIQSQSTPRQTLHVDLEAGSLLTMSYASQLAWLHGIPKVREAVGPRISAAFRMRP